MRATYETNAAVRLRQDGCGFCSSRGVKSASDPNGALRIASDRPLIRYRFSHKTADYLICSSCGTYVAARMDGPDGPIAVISVVGLSIAELKDEPATLLSLDGETREARIAHRVSRWTPMTLIEPSR
ncbi:MAG: hypothetical protein K2P58_10260 [Hyphomonadaceae bacterium]|nr:hypothetical protein [Hyphomonadaceae bacterium]